MVASLMVRHDPTPVVLAKELHANGLSYRKIAAELASRGHATGCGKPHMASAIQRCSDGDQSQSVPRRLWRPPTRAESGCLTAGAVKRMCAARKA